MPKYTGQIRLNGRFIDVYVEAKDTYSAYHAILGQYGTSTWHLKEVPDPANYEYDNRYYGRTGATSDQGSLKWLLAIGLILPPLFYGYSGLAFSAVLLAALCLTFSAFKAVVWFFQTKVGLLASLVAVSLIIPASLIFPYYEQAFKPLSRTAQAAAAFVILISGILFPFAARRFPVGLVLIWTVWVLLYSIPTFLCLYDKLSLVYNVGITATAGFLGFVLSNMMAGLVDVGNESSSTTADDHLKATHSENEDWDEDRDDVSMAELGSLRARIEELRHIIEIERERTREMREERDAWKSLAERLSSENQPEYEDAEHFPHGEETPSDEEVVAALDALGLDRSAAATTISVQYKALLKLYHPDLNGGDRSFEGLLRRTIEAYSLLRNAGYC